MKRFTFLTFLTVAFLFSVLMITSCTKEGAAGKDGIDGAVGPAGPRGEAGVDGIDGTAGCILCHDGGQSQGMFAQVNQWEHSLHATGEAFARNTGACATCHTSQGFLANLAGTYDGIIINNPNPINCYTCHNIHKTFTPADLGLTQTANVQLFVGGATVDFGKGNLCATCHQSRPISPMPVVDGANVTLTSYRYGGHHGPQANVLAGEGLIKMGGTATYGINTHANYVEDGCVACHMAAATGTSTGGHTFNVTNEETGAISYAGCTSCHTSTTEVTAQVKALQLEVQTLLDELQAILTAKGIYDDGSKGHAGYAIAGSQPANLAAAFINWQLATEDKSLGVHNPQYVIGILKNTIAKVK
ncbi:MAG: ammonia-forming cytochrome c nitrite reductase subunit c552 [Bacteroidetes bacterium]|nr:ammonia-forming cytochrome c nitrite reductase subunit c552 [Bacteroidota bacterium]